MITFHGRSMKIFYTRNFHFRTFHLNPSTLVLIPNFLYKYLELLTVYTPFLRLVRLADWRISEILADRPIGRFDLKHGYYEWES
jgi:hypothetical protein